jgi:hypothetical protein
MHLSKFGVGELAFEDLTWRDDRSPSRKLCEAGGHVVSEVWDGTAPVPPMNGCVRLKSTGGIDILDRNTIFNLFDTSYLWRDDRRVVPKRIGNGSKRQ